MTTITVDGKLTPDGRLHFDLPADLPDGDFELHIRVARAESNGDGEVAPTEGSTLGEILAAGLAGAGAEDWAHVGDSDVWIREQRLKRKEARQRRWDHD